MSLKDYLRHRRLAFALRDVRDGENGFLDIALNYGFSSHEAFTRAFKSAYGVTPSEYRGCPGPIVLRTVLRPFDCYLLGIEGAGMAKQAENIKTYFITIPEHKFLHIRNYESIGYWDFWQKQSLIPGQDCETVCGCRGIIREKFRRKCLLWMCPQGNILFLSTDPLILKRRTPRLRRKLSGQ